MHVISAAVSAAPQFSGATQVLGWTAGSIGIVVGMPQAWRLWVERRHVGLSLPSNVLAVLYSTAWLLYGVASRRMVLIATCLVGLCVATAVLAGHLRLSRPPARRWFPGWLVGTAVIGALFLAGREPLGVAASAATISGVAPQLVSLVRRRRRGLNDVSGISVARWVLSSCCNALWFGYGLLIGDRLIMANSSVIALLGVGIIAVTVSAQRRQVVRPAPGYAVVC